MSFTDPQSKRRMDPPEIKPVLVHGGYIVARCQWQLHSAGWEQMVEPIGDAAHETDTAAWAVIEGTQR